MTPTEVSPPTSTPSGDWAHLPLTALAPRIEDRTAAVAVVGLGYVGLPLLVAAGAEGFGLIGVDVDATQVRSRRDRRPYVADVGDEDQLIEAGAQCAPRAPCVLGDDTPPTPESVALDDDLLAGADCVIIMTPHAGIDDQAVAAASPLVSGATGVTRIIRAESVIGL